ncbi:MAG: phosphoglycerate dehydrogenase [Chloroflexota bacterium]
MHKILITDDLSDQGLKLLDEATDISYDIAKGLSETELADKIVDYDALIIRSSVTVTATVLKAAKTLRVIGRAGVGIDNVDLDQASLQGVIVMNTPGANSMATAEHTVAMMLALCRHIPQAYHSMTQKAWKRKQYVGTQLFGKTLGLVGLGRVGSRVATRCKAFGMDVVVYDPYIGDDVARQLDVRLVDLDELFAQADFISLHAVLNAETERCINKDTIAQMKQGVHIINCARGGLIDELDLVEALKTKRVAGAALDVFTAEPLADDSPLRGLENVIFTPHLAASTYEAQIDVSTQIVGQVIDALRETEFRHAVNMPLSDPQIFRVMRPFLELAEKVGSLHAQLSNQRIKKIEIELHGEPDEHIKLLTVGILRGLLKPILQESVNYINAPHLANQRGIAISQTTGLDVPNYTNLISCRASWDGGSRLISATIFQDNEPRIVQIDHYRIDLKPRGRILIIDSVDVPGVIGKMGSILGEDNVNIASMRLGRTKPGGQVLTCIKVDGSVAPSTRRRLEQAQPIDKVTEVVL